MDAETAQAIERMGRVTSEKIKEAYTLRDELRQVTAERDALLEYVCGKGSPLWRKWVKDWISEQRD